MNTAYLQFENVGKRFPGVQALSDVSFAVGEGTVHALMGENGAGKSTLLKVLSGLYRPDAGQLIINGIPRHFHNTSNAIAAGIAVIYQELQLVPQLSVGENLFLGHLPNHAGWLDRADLYRRSAKLLEWLGEDISPKAKVESLSIGQRQMVEIAKSLARQAKVIAFDEPTSSLSSRETDRLFAVIRQLRNEGKVLLYVSHRMDEIYQVCNAATVLRDARHVKTFASLNDVQPDTLVQKMVGRSIEDIFHYTPSPHGDVALRVDGLQGPGVAAPVSFEVRKGEILGFFGLVGAGRSELLKLIYGAETTTAGSIQVAGEHAGISGPYDAIRRGIVLCPEDRKKEGIIAIRSVMENLNLSGRRHFSPLRFFINERAERANAADHVRKLAIKTPSLKQLIGNLSGGNQQKVILGRWLGEDVKIMLLDEPTRGIDVGAKSEIYSIIYDLAKSGIAVIVVSSELPEAMGICDRIAVMRQGRLVGEFTRDKATQERILQMALPVYESIQENNFIQTKVAI
jgi:L-arabinose transport system ATP-binding protein